MKNLAHAIRQLQSGALSRADFFAQLDHVLAAAPGAAGRLLEVLSEEHARAPLADELYSEVQQRIERFATSRQRVGADDTFVQTRPGAPAGPPAGTPASRRVDDPPYGAEPERLKAVGDTLNGRFVLEECIGFGGMGTVYKALDLRKLEASDRKPYIAIKVLNVQFRGHPKSLIALQREARKAQSLAHPNIVSVYDFDRDRDSAMVYLTMEYLSGTSLSQLLRAPGFAGMPSEQAMRIIKGMGAALAYAHERGFVHCDFKPGNVFITDAGKVKVIDFGIARVFQRAEEDVDVTVFDPGSLGALTPAYASPELLERREPDPRDDIYALGCIAYELFTGHHPFNRLSALEARAGAVRPQRPPNIGRKQWRAIKCALAFERKQRTPTVARFLEQISEDGRRRQYLVRGGIALAATVAIAFFGLRYPWPAPSAAPPTESAAAPPIAVPGPVPGPVTAPAPVQAPPSPDANAIHQALAAVPCSALSGSVNGRAVTVAGYLEKGAASQRLQATLAAMPGVGKVNLDLKPLEPDQCAVIATFAPYWLAYRRAGGGARLRLAAPHSGSDNVLTEGDPLAVDVTTGATESFVTVDYFALDGNVVHLMPNPRARDNRAPPGYTATIGSLGEWAIGKPFGSELLVLLTTPSPLFNAMRPVSESRTAYLQALDAQLRRIGAGKVGVDFVQITTRPRPP